MDVKIRNLDIDVVSRIDQKAKKLGKSREEYLRGVLTELSLRSDLVSIEEKYSSLVQDVTEVIGSMNHTLQDLVYLVGKGEKQYD